MFPETWYFCGTPGKYCPHSWKRAPRALKTHVGTEHREQRDYYPADFRYPCRAEIRNFSKWRCFYPNSPHETDYRAAHTDGRTDYQYPGQRMRTAAYYGKVSPRHSLSISRGVCTSKIFYFTCRALCRRPYQRNRTLPLAEPLRNHVALFWGGRPL